jgi:hypothetical protein
LGESYYRIIGLNSDVKRFWPNFSNPLLAPAPVEFLDFPIFLDLIEQGGPIAATLSLRILSESSKKACGHGNCEIPA